MHRVIRAFVLDVHCALSPFVFYVSHVLCASVTHVSYVLFYFTCLACCPADRALCPSSSCAPHPLLASDVLSLTRSQASHVSEVSCFMVLVLELFDIFTSRTKANHCDMPFLEKERHYNVFSYKWYNFPRFIKLNTSTYFIPLISSYSPWKHQESSDFQGIQKRPQAWNGLIY